MVWTGVNLDGADFSGDHTSLGDSQLLNASLRGALLVGTYMGAGSLAGSDLTDADMTGLNTDFGVGLEGVDVTGVTWTNTTCPDGSNSDTNGDNSCEGH